MSLLRPIPAPEPEPALRVPGWPLPAYRFVPGLNPHPFRHPEGHAWEGGRAPTAPVWSGELEPLLRGMDLFDHRFMWECHEHYEGLWKQVPRESPMSLWLQGLIQAGAASLKQHMGQIDAAQRLRDAAIGRLQRLDGVALAGVDLQGLLEQLRAQEPWPLLR